VKWTACLLAPLLAAVAPTAARADEVVAQCVEAFDEAQKLTREGKLLAARDKLDVCAAPTCHAAVRADCLEHRHDVDRAIPTVTFSVRDAAGHDVDASLSVDGRSVDLSRGRSVPLDPGMHEIAYARRGGPPQQARVTVAEGEKSRALAFILKGSEPALTTTETDKPSSPAGPWPWVLVGTGGLFVVGAGALQVLALGKDSEAKAFERDLKGPIDCTSPGVSPSTSTNGTTCGSLAESRDSKKDAARANQTAAIVTGALGLGMIAGGVVWLLVTSPRSKTAARVVPLIGITNGAALTASF
jgi:hypothetical protein